MRIKYCELEWNRNVSVYKVLCNLLSVDCYLDVIVF